MHATKALQNGENPPEIYVSDGSMERNVNFDTMLPAVTFSVAGNIFIWGGNTIPPTVTLYLAW